MTKGRSDVHHPDTPLGRRMWTEKQTGEEFTTETTRQSDGTYLCLVVESPEIRAVADTPEKATSRVLTLMETRMNTEEDSHAEDADDIRVLREREHGRFLTRDQFLRKHGRL
jgi:hypothetical protein